MILKNWVVFLNIIISTYEMIIGTACVSSSEMRYQMTNGIGSEMKRKYYFPLCCSQLENSNSHVLLFNIYHTAAYSAGFPHARMICFPISS